MLLQQNSVTETKIFTKIIQYTRSDLSLQCVAATCCCNLLTTVYRPYRNRAEIAVLMQRPYPVRLVPSRYLCVFGVREDWGLG